MRERIKRGQLWLHHHYRTIRLTIVVAAIVAVAVGFAVLIVNQNRLLAEVQKLGQQNKNLNLQTKNIGEQNQSIAKQNRAYTRCIATVFAQYTHDFLPITITNLDTCTVDSQSQATNNTSTGGSVSSPQSDAQPEASAAPSNPAPQASSSSQPSQAPSKPLNCTVDLLGLHIGCP